MSLCDSGDVFTTGCLGAVGAALVFEMFDIISSRKILKKSFRTAVAVFAVAQVCPLWFLCCNVELLTRASWLEDSTPCLFIGPMRIKPPHSIMKVSDTTLLSEKVLNVLSKKVLSKNSCWCKSNNNKKKHHRSLKRFNLFYEITALTWWWPKPVQWTRWTAEYAEIPVITFVER